MATTTNYGWTTPNDTDLVKDGAAAIRTLGSAVDTTTKNLNPSTTLGDIEYRSATANTNTRLGIGSTGQVLTVAGGVPTWATSDDANAIQNAIVDAKGDIVAASAADTPARLAVGTDNHRLIAASGETTGLKYVADTQNTVIDAEGDLLVGDAADTIQRLAIGTTGHVLTVDTAVDGKVKWAAPSAGGMTLLSTTTMSSTSTTVNITDTSYINLFVVVSGATTSGGGYADIALRYNGITSGYYGANYADNQTAVERMTNVAQLDTAIGASTNQTNTSNLLTFTITNYANTGYHNIEFLKTYLTDGSVLRIMKGIGSNSNTSAISSLTFFGVNTYNAGTVKIYGVK